MTKVICDICGKEIDKRAIHLHMRVHEREKGGEVEEGGKIYDYHVLFPNLTCVVRDGNNVYTTPVLALHISAEGGWMIICDRNGNLVRSDDIHGECYICSGKREVQKLLKTLKKSEKQGGLLERLRSRKVKKENEADVRSELSEKTMTELISALKEFARKKRGEEEDEL